MTTIKETFALSTTDAGAPGEQNLKSLFEFFRKRPAIPPLRSTA